MATIIPIPAFSDNYIWLMRANGGAAVVDPGDADPVFEYLDREGLSLTAIVATHHHLDHVGGVSHLLERYDVPVFGPAREEIPGRTHAMSEGDAIVVPGVGVKLEVIDIPGHTAGHIAYTGMYSADSIAFVGDTLFAAGCGRLFEGTPPQMVDSLAKLAALPGRTKVYCGHEYTLANLRFALAVEPHSAALHERIAREQVKRDRGLPTLPSTIADELSTNPFLRCAEPAVIAAATAHAGHAQDGPVATFATLRSWKNSFRG